MADLNKMVEKLDALSIQECSDLVPMLEKRWGVLARPVAPAYIQPEKVKEVAKTEFDVELTSYGEKKINVIKVVRAITSLPLKEAKELIEKAPVMIKEGVSENEALEIKMHLEKEGAVVVVR